MRMQIGAAHLGIPALLLLACGPQTTPFATPQPAPIPGPSDTPYDPGPLRDPDPGPTDDAGNPIGDDAANCGGMEFALTRVPPNVMLVIDRSGSMAEPISSTSNTSKWQDLLAAMAPVLSTYDGEIRFGLDLFGEGDDASCTPGSIAVPVGANHGALIQSTILAAVPNPSTPTAATLDVVIQNGMLNDASRDNLVVLATDGMPNCSQTVGDVTQRIQTLYSATPSVKTYVIGVGSATASNPAALNSWATAGHTAKASSPRYYQSNSAADLKTAFDAIVGGIVSCTFKMAQAAPDPTQLYVWSGGVSVSASTTNGYTYDANGPSVTLHGPPCDLLKSTPNTKIQVVYGCPAPPDPG